MCGGCWVLPCASIVLIVHVIKGERNDGIPSLSVREWVIGACKGFVNIVMQSAGRKRIWNLLIIAISVLSSKVIILIFYCPVIITISNAVLEMWSYFFIRRHLRDSPRENANCSLQSDVTGRARLVYCLYLIPSVFWLWYGKQCHLHPFCSCEGLAEREHHGQKMCVWDVS